MILSQQQLADSITAKDPYAEVGTPYYRCLETIATLNDELMSIITCTWEPDTSFAKKWANIETLLSKRNLSCVTSNTLGQWGCCDVLLISLKDTDSQNMVSAVQVYRQSGNRIDETVFGAYAINMIADFYAYLMAEANQKFFITFFSGLVQGCF